MNLLVCVKQVPDTTEIRIDPETHTLIREGVPSIVNPYDACALALAVRLREAHGGEVTALCMGPPQATAALQNCLAHGADNAVLITDRVFGGSDTLATSYILSAAVGRLEKQKGVFDLILCGKQAIDGDTAQVGPELAEWLDRPQITCVLEAVIRADSLHATGETDDGRVVIRAPLPALVTVTKTAFEPRIPSIRARMEARRAEITHIGSAELNLDLARVGLKGSPTKVKKTFTPEVRKDGVIIREATAAASAGKLAELLHDAALV